MRVGVVHQLIADDDHLLQSADVELAVLVVDVDDVVIHLVEHQLEHVVVELDRHTELDEHQHDERIGFADLVLVELDLDLDLDLDIRLDPDQLDVLVVVDSVVLVDIVVVLQHHDHDELVDDADADRSG